MKRPFSLLEICIGLALTTILLTTLFSGLRHLIGAGAEVGKFREELYPSLVLQLRMSQVLEKLNPDSLFYTEPHIDAKGPALYFTFSNGIDPDPNFCGKIEGALFRNKEDELILKLKNERIETLWTKVHSFEMNFFDAKEKKWIREWKQDTLPALLSLEIHEKKYTFLFPKMNLEVEYR